MGMDMVRKGLAIVGGAAIVAVVSKATYNVVQRRKKAAKKKAKKGSKKASK